jgi:hypothetical protein
VRYPQRLDKGANPKNYNLIISDHLTRQPTTSHLSRIFVNMLTALLLILSLKNTALAYHLHILNTHEKHGAAPCLTTCVGTTSRGSTPWETVHISPHLPAPLFKGLSNIVKTSVDISECHFISTPVVTTTIDFNSDDAKALTFLSSLVSGSSSIAETSKDSFSVYLHGFQDTRYPLVAAGAGLFIDVHWTAFGYVC